MTREWFYSLVLGLAAIAGGSWLTHAAIHMTPVSEKLVILGVIGCIIGGLLINPTPGKPAPLLVALQGAVIIIAPLWPFGKGAAARRASVERPVVKPDSEIK